MTDHQALAAAALRQMAVPLVPSPPVGTNGRDEEDA